MALAEVFKGETIKMERREQESSLKLSMFRGQEKKRKEMTEN